jgi:hypothetical protein
MHNPAQLTAMSHQIVKIKASELVEDFSLYPRNCVFEGHVYDIRQAIASGAVMPPVVGCSELKAVIDGFHRRRALIAEFGADVEIDCMLVDYASNAERVCDAIARNSTHGRRLTTADIAKCAQLAKTFKISRERLEGLLHVTRKRLAEITATRIATSGDREVIVRRPMAHLAGTELTDEQVAVSSRVGGQPAITHVNILISLIESHSLPADIRLMRRLERLHDLIDELSLAKA